MNNVSFNYVYLGLGANTQGVEKRSPVETIREALASIQRMPGVINFSSAPLYQTKPVSDIPQELFVNTVCEFVTNLDAVSLFYCLEEIEAKLGKVPKEKNLPRPIDIDLIFYGNRAFKLGYTDIHKRDCELEVPHPRWKGRLFVLVPLSNVVTSMFVDDVDGPGQSMLYDIAKMINAFSQEALREVWLLPELKVDRPLKLQPTSPPRKNKTALHRLVHVTFEGCIQVKFDTKLANRNMICQFLGLPKVYF